MLTLIGLGAVASSMIGVISTPAPIHFSAGLIAHQAGMLAGYGVAVMLMLMARIPALEHGVGADRIARWHARGGRALLVLILVHASAATVGWAQLQQIDLPAATVQVLGFPGLLAATLGTVLFCLVGVVSIRAARARVSYETWHLIHLSTYLAVALSFAHELAGPDLAGRPAVQVYWSLLYTAAFALVLRYRLLEPVLRAIRHRLRVETVIPESADVVSLVIRGRHLDDLRAEPGQFFRWRFLTSTTWTQTNPFSLSAPPTDDRLRLTVQAVGDGTRAIHAIRPGVRVLAEGPYGAMTEHRRAAGGVLLLAGGVGITPMRALFETVDRSRGPVTLIYRVPSQKDALFEPELRHIAARRGGELVLLAGRSSDPALALTAANLHQWAPGIAGRDVFICAGSRFSTAAHAALHDAGVPPQRIHQEEFVF